MLDEMFGAPTAAPAAAPAKPASAATATPNGASPWAGKLLVVTGGAGAIGSEVCRYALERHLMVVAVVDLDAAHVDRVVRDLQRRHAGSQVHGFVSDVSKLEEQQRLAKRIEDATGMVPHIVLLCAGINRSTPLLRATPADMRATMGANFWGIYNGVLAFYPGMERADGGCKKRSAAAGSAERSPRSRHIISVASMAGVCQCMGTYGVSKHAVVGLSESFELELTQRGSPVAMACMVPGWIKTADPFSLGDMPAQRVAEEMFDGITRGRFLMTTHPNLLPVSLRGRLDYLLPRHAAAAALGNAAVDAKIAELASGSGGGGGGFGGGCWDYNAHAEKPSDVLHVALADTAKGFSSEILGSFATEYVDNRRLLERIKAAKEAEAALATTAAAGTSSVGGGGGTGSSGGASQRLYRLDGLDGAGKPASCAALEAAAAAAAAARGGGASGDLAGKWALVTGASRGIGESIALALAARGCSVVLASRSEAALNTVAERCRAAGAPEALVHACDLGDAAAVGGLCDATLAGGRTMDVLVNCAGIAIMGGCLQGDPTASAAEWAQLMQVNLLTPMLLSQRCAPGMKARRAGLIVNVGSESGTTTQSMVPVYAASKHGLRGWSYNTHHELRPHGVRVLCVNPDWVNTPMVKGVPGLNPKNILQCADIVGIILGALRLPAADPLADVAVILTDKAAAWAL